MCDCDNNKLKGTIHDLIPSELDIFYKIDSPSLKFLQQSQCYSFYRLQFPLHTYCYNILFYL